MENKLNNEPPGPVAKYPNLHWLMILIFPYIVAYTLLGLWLILDGFFNGFSSIYWIWDLNREDGFSELDKHTLFSLVGSIIGCGALDIVSFHKYIAIKKVFDVDHTWGFFFSPVLAAIIGLMVFALFQSGLLVFAGTVSNENAPVTAELGFTAIGFISGYSWPNVISKFRDISDGLFPRASDSSDAKGPSQMAQAETETDTTKTGGTSDDSNKSMQSTQ